MIYLNLYNTLYKLYLCVLIWDGVRDKLFPHPIPNKHTQI